MKKKKFKLKLTKRPVQGAYKFGQELARLPFNIDMMGMAILCAIGKWSQHRSLRLIGDKFDEKGRHRKMHQQALLGLAIVAILVTAEKHQAIITFQTMDSFIEVETKQGMVKKIDYALGLFTSAFSKWCISVNSYRQPDHGVVQQMLQLMLSAVGLMCYLSKLDPVVDCLLPFYKIAITKVRTEGEDHGHKRVSKHTKDKGSR